MTACAGAAQGCGAGHSLEAGADCVGGASTTTAEAEAVGALGHGNGGRNAEHLDHRGVGGEDIEAGENATEVDAIASGLKLDASEVNTGVDITTDGVFTVDGRDGEGAACAGTLANGEGPTGGISFDNAIVIGVDREGAGLDFIIGAAFDIFNDGGEGIVNGVACHH